MRSVADILSARALPPFRPPLRPNATAAWSLVGSSGGNRRAVLDLAG